MRPPSNLKPLYRGLWLIITITSQASTFTLVLCLAISLPGEKIRTRSHSVPAFIRGCITEGHHPRSLEPHKCAMSWFLWVRGPAGSAGPAARGLTGLTSQCWVAASLRRASSKFTPVVGKSCSCGCRCLRPLFPHYLSEPLTRDPLGSSLCSPPTPQLGDLPVLKASGRPAPLHGFSFPKKAHPINSGPPGETSCD